MAKNMDSMVCEATDAILETITDERVESCIETEIGEIGKPSNQRFKGMNFAEDALEMLKGSLQFSMTYPSSIDKESNEAMVNTAILFSPYEKECDGSLSIVPRLTGGFITRVRIPSKNVKIRNHIYSPELGKYWRKQVNTAGLWSGLITDVAGIAWDRALFGSNMSLEGYLNVMKNQTSSHRDSVANIPSFMMHRWEECVQDGAYLSKQIQNLGRKLAKRSSKAKRKRETVREDDTEPIWKRKFVAGIQQTDDVYLVKLKRAMVAAREANENAKDAKKYEYDEKNISSMFKVMIHVQKRIGGKFMSAMPFYDWLNKRRNGPPKSSIDFINDFYNEYVVK